jgi:hypothetical protein
MTQATRFYRARVAFSFWHSRLLQAGSGQKVGYSEVSQKRGSGKFRPAANPRFWADGRLLGSYPQTMWLTPDKS